MTLLEDVRGPDDLKRLDAKDLPALATEIRDFLVAAVSKTGGHLGPNLGVVELTIALHRVFDSPRDRLVWDTGHQAYVHKILTGRQGGFATLRQPGGLSGYPSQAESVHDIVENSHASTALSYADGLAKAYALRGERRSVVAVVGDGALTGGMAWEALNTIASCNRPVVIVVNDNGRSYAPTIGGLQQHLAALRMTQGYEQVLDTVKRTLSSAPLVGPPLYDVLHRLKDSLKDVMSPQVLFEDLGLKYVGPIDGHDIGAVENALRKARDFGGPVIVHCLTRKGFGYQPAEDDEADCFHGVSVIDPVTGRPLATGAAPSWTNVFSEEIVRIGAERPDVVAITAAMLEPVGLGAFSRAYPDRVYDVGIAEQHAVTSAAGLALGGMHPVVCVYATFLNRAFDQVVMDVALHRLPVTIVLDRAGVTGEDGPSHNGMWDLAAFQGVPGLSVAAPRDAATLRELLRESVALDAPSIVRFPKGGVGDDIPAIGARDGMDLLRAGTDVLLVGVGAMARVAVDAATLLADHGIEATVVDPRWVKPVNDGLVTLARSHRRVVTIEDGLRSGGVGAALAMALADAGVEVPVMVRGLPQEFLAQGKRDAILAEHGLTATEVAASVIEAFAREETAAL